MAKKKNNVKKPKATIKPAAGKPKSRVEPDSYKTKHPVWRFRSFDWDGPWGVAACVTKDWRKHLEKHLADLETMTWAAIESASGGKTEGGGTNSHPISRDKFSKNARARLKKTNVLGDSFFSLRLENTVRIYGIREDNSLRVIWFDPFHFKGDQRAVYDW